MPWITTLTSWSSRTSARLRSGTVIFPSSRSCPVSRMLMPRTMGGRPSRKKRPRGLAFFAVHEPTHPCALVRYYVAGRLELGDEHADGQQDFLAGASLGTRGDSFLPVFPHFLGEK